MPYDQELIPREHFVDMVSAKKVVNFPYGHGGIILEVKDLLLRNAATMEAIADKLKIDVKTASNAISHLRSRYHLNIGRYYYPKDKKYYYFVRSD